MYTAKAVAVAVEVEVAKDNIVKGKDKQKKTNWQSREGIIDIKMYLIFFPSYFISHVFHELLQPNNISMCHYRM